MPSETLYGFWSYAHEDNELDHGNILGLARLIKEEYNLLSGEPLELFIDVDGIGWGDEWRKRIDSSLVQTTFFIPIVTPRYFKRPECRRELLEFAAKAKGLGIEELLLPILYIGVPGLSPESTDQAAALIARTQYVDWRNTRLMNPGSREFRTEVHALASRPLEVGDRVAASLLSRELAADSRECEAEGISDVVEKINSLLPDWLEAVQDAKFLDAQIDATGKTYLHQIEKLSRAKAPPSATLATEIRLARQLLPIAKREQEAAQIYTARSVELDPLVSTLVRLITEHPESSPLIGPIREGIDEAIASIRLQEKRMSIVGWRFFSDIFREKKHLGRIFQECTSVFHDVEQMTIEGNSIVLRWDSELPRGLSSESTGS